MSHKTLWAALLAAAALIVHFAAPLALIDGDAVWASEWNDEPMDPVAGASMGLLLTGLILTTVGTVATFLMRRLDRSTPWQVGSAFVGLIGIGLAVRAAGLWVGRGVATLVEALLRSDAPGARFTAEGMSPDHFQAVWPLAPVASLGLLIAAGFLLLAELGRNHPNGRAHVRPVAWMMVVLAMVAVLPWAIEETADRGVAEGVEDNDPFLISAYDATRLHQDTETLADRIGEEGLREYDGVAWIHGATLLGFLGACFSLTGLIGTWRAEEEDAYLGRTLEYVGAAAAGIAAVLTAAGIVTVAGFLYGASERVDASPAWAPLAAVVPAFLALVAVVGTWRRLSTDRDQLIADRFPEPIVYE